jgi:hypothetical protein
MRNAILLAAFRTRDLEFSREAAQEYSPRRQPWVVVNPRRSPEGATETNAKDVPETEPRIAQEHIPRISRIMPPM